MSPTNLVRLSLAVLLPVAATLWPNAAGAAPPSGRGDTAGALHRGKSAEKTADKTAHKAARKAGSPIQARHTRPTVARAGKKSHPTSGKPTVSLERRIPAIKGGFPNVQAQGALVLDEDGRELYSRMPDRERPIASISKLAATLVVMDRGLELEGITTITRADIDIARGGARSRLLEGMKLSNRDLLHAALMGSDNRAIPALGRAVKLSPSQLATAMTAKTRELGLTKTRFHDPTGLSIENVSTPRETIALLRAVMSNPVLGPITQRVEYDAHPIGKPRITYVNTYRPAMRNHVQVLGGKTGYNDDARYCLVLAAKIDGKTCFMSFLANEGKLTRFGDVARVADWIVNRKPKGQRPTLAEAASTRAPATFTPPYAPIKPSDADPDPAPSAGYPFAYGPTTLPPSPAANGPLPFYAPATRSSASTAQTSVEAKSNTSPGPSEPSTPATR